jgi:hypothetical protein
MLAPFLYAGVNPVLLSVILPVYFNTHPVQVYGNMGFVPFLRNVALKGLNLEVRING